jgi:hypothetical protein
MFSILRHSCEFLVSFFDFFEVDLWNYKFTLKSKKMRNSPIRNKERKQREFCGEISENGESSVKYRAKRASRAKLAIYF